ncbi:hypothetical protein ACET3Z_019206 [Daucus carota]
MKIYSVSTRHYYAIGALIDQEICSKLRDMPQVLSVNEDTYIDVEKRDYGGEPFIDGRPVPYDRKYHAAYWAMQEDMLYFPTNMDDHKDAEMRATNSASPDKEADYKLSILRAWFSRVGVWWNETMNMCSKCYKDMILKHGLEKLAATSTENIVHGGSGSTHKEPAVGDTINLQAGDVQSKFSTTLAPGDSSSSNQDSKVKVKVAPNRWCSCGKRVGLTGFSCRCGNLYCADHRYPDKHECSFDYQAAAGKNAIRKANPVIKREKLDKI